METKNNDEFIKSKRGSLQYPNFYYVPPIGLSGGLCVLWKDSVNINILEACPNVINSEIKFKGSSSFVSFIYGEPIAGDRACFWNKLSDIVAERDSSWPLTGDFNEILDDSEKEGGPARWEGSFTAFRSFVSQHGIWDLKHSGNHLSWRGTRYSHLINLDWISRW
ncbi:hypothetical protein N665_0017s0117 [Sinapis alba]|nr:hypothetical protein N665_0017s0117 [Sinapis alba]